MPGINRKFFFEHVRLNLFDGIMKHHQVEGLIGFLDYWEQNLAEEDDRWLAYILATAHHEVDRKMTPIKEYGSVAYFKRMYDIEGDEPHVAKQLGNIHQGDGVKFHGRGFVQITGRTNYADWGNRLAIDLVNDPDLALQLDVATSIIFRGMIEGTFTTKSLSDYFSANKEDWRNARRVVKGTDKADLIASYGKKYYAAISYTTG